MPHLVNMAKLQHCLAYVGSTQKTGRFGLHGLKYLGGVDPCFSPNPLYVSLIFLAEFILLHLTLKVLQRVN
jgi:hypothetical protein